MRSLKDRILISRRHRVTEKTPKGITLVKETIQSKPLLRLAGLLILIWGGWNLLEHTGKKAAARSREENMPIKVPTLSAPFGESCFPPR